MIECSPSTHEALGLISSTRKKSYLDTRSSGYVLESFLSNSSLSRENLVFSSKGCWGPREGQGEELHALPHCPPCWPGSVGGGVSENVPLS